MTSNRLVACMLSNKSPRHAITSCSGVNSFLWIRRPFHLSLGIKQLSRLINLTDRPHCAQCQPQRKPYCLLSWRLTFLLFFDSSYLKEALGASPVIDLKKTALSIHIIECLKQKLWSLTGAYNLSAEIQWNGLHHCICLFGCLYIEHNSPPGYILTLPSSLFPTSSYDETEMEFVQMCVCVRACTCMLLCVFVKVKKEKERRSKPKCNLSLNHRASPGERPFFLGLVSELNHSEGPIFQK